MGTILGIVIVLGLIGKVLEPLIDAFDKHEQRKAIRKYNQNH